MRNYMFSCGAQPITHQIASACAPELWCEDDEHGEYLKSPHEHEEGAYPLGKVGQIVPRHGRTYLDAKRRAYVAQRGKGDGYGVRVVDARGYHGEGAYYAEEGIDGEEGEERGLALIGDVAVAYAEGEHGTGMEHLLELVCHNLEEHDASHGLEASGGAAGAASDEHAEGKYYPRDVRPQGGIVAEESGSGEEGDDLEDAAAEGFLKVVAVVEHQLDEDEEGEEEREKHIEPELDISEDIGYLPLDHDVVEEDEVDAGEEAEEGGDILYGYGMEVEDTVVMGGESSCGDGGHGVVGCIIPLHAEESEAECANDGEEEEYGPDGLGGAGESGMKLGLDGSRSLRGEDLHVSAHHGGQHGYGEEDYSESAYPLGDCSPEEYAMWKLLHIVEYGCTGGGEAGHGLEECVGKVGDISSYHERQCAKQGKDGPGKGDDEKGIATAHPIACIATEEAQAEAHCKRDEDGHGESETVFIPITQ